MSKSGHGNGWPRKGTKRRKKAVEQPRREDAKGFNHGWKWMTRISTKGSEETGRPVVHIRLQWRVGEKRDGHKKAQRRTKVLIKAQLSLLMGSAGNEQRRREEGKGF